MERLTKNFIWMAAANITASLFTILAFIYLARTLLPEAFGYLSYATTLIFYLSNFVDLGLSTYGIREVSKYRVRVKEYVSEIVSFRLIIASILYILFILIMVLSHHSDLLKLLMAGAGLMLFVSALSTEWAFQGIEWMHMVFISFATTTSLQLGLIYTFIKGPKDILKTPVLHFVAAFPIIMIFLSHFKFRLKIKKIYLRNIGSYLSSSLIIWSSSMFAQLYNNLDIVILGLFKPVAEVGYFTVARRAVGGATLLVIFLANALLPRLSSTFSEDAAQFKLATRKFLSVSTYLTVLILLPIIFFSKEFIILTVGDRYLPVTIPFKIMVLGFILVLFNLPYSTGLIAAGFEKDVLKQTMASAILSVSLNIVYIPKYGMMSAAVSFLLAEALALIWIRLVYQRRITDKLNIGEEVNRW